MLTPVRASISRSESMKSRLQALGQRPAYGRLAGAHQPDEIEVFAEL
jgi:hypothetical protein